MVINESRYMRAVILRIGNIWIPHEIMMVERLGRYNRGRSVFGFDVMAAQLRQGELPY